MGVTVSDENVDDQPPNEFCKLLESVGKDIKDQSQDRPAWTQVDVAFIEGEQVFPVLQAREVADQYIVKQ